jgi:probable phosphoglycerate mutase
VTRLVVIRHGESACNVNGVVGGEKGCSGLSGRGRTQVESLRERLAATRELAQADALYSSTLERAVETAEGIRPVVGGGDLKIVSLPTLCELRPGEADGLTWDECRELYGVPDWEQDTSAVVSPGGETWHGFVDRASEAVRILADRHAGGLVVIACHGGVIEATMLSFLPMASHNRPLGLPTAYTSMTEWDLDSDRWRLMRYNDVAHLGGPYEAQRSGPHRPLQQA